MYTLDEFIERLQKLREVTGGDVPVLLQVYGGVWTNAAAETQNVVERETDFLFSSPDPTESPIQAISIY